MVYQQNNFVCQVRSLNPFIQFFVLNSHSGAVDANGRCTAPSSFNSPTPPASSRLASTISPNLPSPSIPVSGLPGGQLGTQSVLESLEKCAPCGKSSCTFTSQVRLLSFFFGVGHVTYIYSNGQGTSSSDVYSLVIGNPVANCQKGNNQSVKTRYTAAMEIQETWSFDRSLGLAIRGLDVGGGSGWSKSRTITASQEVELTVIPGQLVRNFKSSRTSLRVPIFFQGALVANVSYKTTSGRMKIGSRWIFLGWISLKQIMKNETVPSASFLFNLRTS